MIKTPEQYKEQIEALQEQVKELKEIIKEIGTPDGYDKWDKIREEVRDDVEKQ